MTIKSRQKLKYLENKKSFLLELKSIFHHFFSSQKLSQTWECAFKVFYRCLTVNLNLNWYFLRDIINRKKYFAVFREISMKYYLFFIHSMSVVLCYIFIFRYIFCYNWKVLLMLQTCGVTCSCQVLLSFHLIWDVSTLYFFRLKWGEVY